jgi:hypothetical protein
MELGHQADAVEEVVGGQAGDLQGRVAGGRRHPRAPDNAEPARIVHEGLDRALGGESRAAGRRPHKHPGRHDRAAGDEDTEARLAQLVHMPPHGLVGNGEIPGQGVDADRQAMIVRGRLGEGEMPKRPIATLGDPVDIGAKDGQEDHYRDEILIQNLGEHPRLSDDVVAAKAAGLAPKIG